MFGLAVMAPDPEVELTVVPPPAPELAAVADGPAPEEGGVLAAKELTPAVDTDDEETPDEGTGEDDDSATASEDVHPAAATIATANNDPANKNPRLRMHPP